MDAATKKNRLRLAELHSHLGASVSPPVLWSIAHDQGIKLPTKDYWEFEDMVVIKRPFADSGGVALLDEKYYKLTELIQSSPDALENAVRRVIGGAYRTNNIVVHELRFNPAKRNRGGERDLDYIILSVLNGIDRALLEYSDVRAGVILEMDRTFSYDLNEIIYKKACQYQARGVIGIDIAGPQHKAFDIREYEDIFKDAKRRGLGTTVHTGEEGDTEEMRFIVTALKPGRIGHGVIAATDPELMGLLKEASITLELCPTSNLNIGIMPSWEELERTYRILFDAGVLITINTDGPEMHNTNMKKELALLREHSVFTDSEIELLVQNSFDATFLEM